MDLNHIKQLRWESIITYDVGNVISYNLAIGASGKDLTRSWEEHPQFHALPTFASIPVINVMGKVTRDMPSFLPAYQPQKHPHVHGEHLLRLKQQFPTSGTLRSVARITDVVDRRTGVAVVVGITTTNSATNSTICYSEWTSFLMGMPGDGASNAQSRKLPSARPPTRQPDAVVSHQTTSEQGALYRAATGEWNPMHIDPGHGKRAGFPGPILSGTCTIGIGVKHVIDTFAGGDSSRFESVKLRLTKPVFPGEVIQTHMWVEDGGRFIVYEQKALDGRVVISQAMVRLKSKTSREGTVGDIATTSRL